MTPTTSVCCHSLKIRGSCGLAMSIWIRGGGMSMCGAFALISALFRTRSTSSWWRGCWCQLTDCALSWHHHFDDSIGLSGICSHLFHDLVDCIFLELCLNGRFTSLPDQIVAICYQMLRAPTRERTQMQITQLDFMQWDSNLLVNCLNLFQRIQSLVLRHPLDSLHIVLLHL